MAVTDALYNTKTTSYDELGDVTMVTDPLGYSTEYLYDNLGRKIEEIEPDPVTGAASPTDASCPKTYYGYDLDGNLTRLTDADGQLLAICRLQPVAVPGLL